MKKIKKRLISAVIFILIVLPSIFPLLRSGYFPIHDDIQAFRLLELDKCVKDGQIPCRWIPDMGYGYGYPQFNYYNPLPYYLMELVHLTGIGFLDSTKTGFGLSILVSAIGMYLLAGSFWGKLGGMLAAVFYVYAPYRAVNVYVRGAMGEAWGMAILPFIFWATKQVVEKRRFSQLWLALSIAALFTSHNITALIFVPFYAIWVLYLLNEKRKYKSTLFGATRNIVFSGLWGLAMGAFFILPAYIEKNLVHVETLLMGYFNYLAHYVGLVQLLFSTKFGYGSSELGPVDDILLSPGIIHWVVPLVVLALFTVTKRIKKVKILILLIALGWFSLFMIHPRSVFIWQRFNILSFVQFPWRFLTMATIFFSWSVGAVVVFFKKKAKLLSVLLLGGIVFLANILYFKPDYRLDITDDDKFSGESWQKQLTISIFDYLPVSAKFPPNEKAPNEPLINEGEGIVVGGTKGTDWQNWEIVVNSLRAEVVFPLYYFPIWTAEVNGQISEIAHDNDLGLITLVLDAGVNDVYLELKDTPIRIFSNYLTLVALGLIPVYVWIKRKDVVKI